MSTIVVVDFLHHRIAPLRARVRPTWFYTGVDDTTRTRRGMGLDIFGVEVAELLMLIVEVRDPATGILPGDIMPLCEDPTRHTLLSMLSEIDVCGLFACRARLYGGIRIEGGVDRSLGTTAPRGNGKHQWPSYSVPVGSSSSSSPPPSPTRARLRWGEGRHLRQWGG